MGVIQKGEIVVEYRANGSARRSTHLTAGSCFQPPDWNAERNVSSVSAYAATDVTLYALHSEKLRTLQSRCPTLDAVLTPAYQGRIRGPLWGKLWAVIVAVVIVLLVWHDATRALSGAFYLVSDELPPPVGYQEIFLLSYAMFLDPQAAHTYNKEGYTWAQMASKRLAIASFAQALSVDGANGPALNNLAAIYFTDGIAHKATAFQQRAAEADPNTAAIRYNLGLMLTEQGDYLGAARTFKEATRIDPNWALPYLHLSFINLQIEDYGQAEQAARTAALLDPAQQSAHLSLAIALYQQGKSQEAHTSIGRAMEMNPDDVVSRFYQALILHDLGDHNQALLILRQLLNSPAGAQQRARIASEIESILRFSEPLSGDQ